MEVSDNGYSIDDGIPGNGDGVKDGVDKKDTKTITVSFRPTPYQIWRAEKFPESYTTPLDDLPDDEKWDEESDPDNDGLTNEMEMELGSNPRVPTVGLERSALFLAQIIPSSPAQLSTTTKEDGIISAQSIGSEGDDVQLYARRPKLEGLEADIEFSTNLSGWTPIPWSADPHKTG